MKIVSFLSLIVSAALPVAVYAEGFVDPGFGGSTVTETWYFNTANGVGGGSGGAYGMGPWANGVVSASTTDSSYAQSVFNKVSGGAYATGNSLYTLFSTETVFSVTNSDPMANLETLFLQVDIAAQQSFTDIILSIDGGTPFSYTDVFIIDSEAMEFNGQEGVSGIFGFQWDLRGLGSISEYTISFAAGQHTSLNSIRVDEGGVYAQAIPEPSTYALLGFGIVAAGVAYRRRRAVCA